MTPESTTGVLAKAARGSGWVRFPPNSAAYRLTMIRPYTIPLDFELPLLVSHRRMVPRWVFVLISITSSSGVFHNLQGVAPENTTERQFLVLQNACDWWNQPANGCEKGRDQRLYVKSVRVFSCGDWNTTQCNRPVLMGAP